jgi:hypothetical protein
VASSRNPAHFSRVRDLPLAKLPTRAIPASRAVAV